jgi:hypothetical protein
MRHVSMAGAVAVLAALVFGVPSLTAGTGSTTCTDTLAPGTYHQVVVPASTEE